MDDEEEDNEDVEAEAYGIGGNALIEWISN